MELLRDPVWQFAGAALTVFAILVSLAIYYAQRVRKRLAVEVIRNGRILTIAEESVGNLQLVFNGQPVHDARLVETRITNIGNQAITPSDFVSSLFLSLNQEAAILSATVVETVPNGLPATLNFSDNVIEIVPLRLNPKDSITIKLLASRYRSGPTANARINGVSRITEVRQRYIVDVALIGMSYACMGIVIWLQPPKRKHLLCEKGC